MSMQILPPSARPVPDCPRTEAKPYPLENGDKLTLAEFERRYEAMPNVKAELIEGIVYMGSPVGHKRHGRPHARVVAWLAIYIFATPVVDGGADSSVRLDDENMAQPDAFLYIKPEFGGRIEYTEDDYLKRTPELIIEVASSTANYDLHAKLRTYQKHETPEYVVWRTRDQTIDWFVLRSGQYVRLEPIDGVFRSEVFPGLWLDPAAIINDDRAAMVRVNQLGVDSPEHAAFVERLRSKAS